MIAISSSEMNPRFRFFVFSIISILTGIAINQSTAGDFPVLKP